MTEYKYPIPASETVVGEEYMRDSLGQELQPYLRINCYPHDSDDMNVPFLYDNGVVTFDPEFVLYSDTDPSIITAGELAVGEWCETVKQAGVDGGHKYRRGKDRWYSLDRNEMCEVGEYVKVRPLPAPVWPDEEFEGGELVSFNVLAEKAQQRDALVAALRDERLQDNIVCQAVEENRGGHELLDMFTAAACSQAGIESEVGDGR